MSRMILFLLAAAALVAIAGLVISVFSSGNASSSVAQKRSNGVQKIAYGLLIALMFGVSTGALTDG